MSYLDWLAMIAMPDGEMRYRYAKVLYVLDQIEFTWLDSVPFDKNRCKDGEQLRVIFEDETELPCDKYGPCSVLEMMVALAARCEGQLMYDPDEGDRTSIWFWEMFENLGLDSYGDSEFDESEVRRIVMNFLNREYYPDGYLGPFYVAECKKDLRKVDLWYQLNLYMQEKYFKNL